MRNVLFLILVTLVITGCQTDNRNGKGPVTLSSRSMTNLGVYLSEDRPISFALADDGKSAKSSYCEIGHTLGCLGDGGAKVLASCNRSAKVRGGTCFLFADRQQIVWDGPISYEGFSDDYLFAYTKEVAGGKRSYGGKGTLVEKDSKIVIKVGPCWGVADLNTKKWFIKDCKNGYSAQGTFIAGEGLVKYQGTGRSGEGGAIRMLFFDPSADPRFSKANVSKYSPNPDFEDRIRARIEAAKSETGGEGQESRPLANTPSQDICDGLKYGNPDYAEEAKRRGISAGNCADILKK
jgi:hypothetical protein